MGKPCTSCGGKFMWLQHNLVTSNDIDNRIHVDVFRCTGCGYLFIVDKTSQNPNRHRNINKFDEEQKKKHKKYEPKATYDEEVFYGVLYINSKGKLGIKPKDYVSTKPYTLGGKTYPPIRKARVRGKKK